MSGIQDLQTLYKKEGLLFIKNLFNNEVIISEKLNATRFAFKKTQDNKFIFYKKDSEITLTERTINKLFEKPIKYIESLDDEIKSKILVDYVYGFRYFHNTTPIFVKYDNLPKNDLVLTDIKNRSNKSIEDMNVLNNIADILSVERPPIIWNGKLTDNQIVKITEYLKLTDEELVKKYNNKSFTHFIISTLNPSLKNSFLANSLNNNIDSIIFKFVDNNTKKTIIAKLVDPIIDNIKYTYNTKKEVQDMFGIILSDIVEFIMATGYDKYKLTKVTKEELYLELMYKIYNDYINKNVKKFLNVNLDAPEFSMSPDFDLNFDLIFNKRTVELINKSDINKQIFKIIISTFSKKRYKQTLIITKELIRNIKQLQKDIDKKISNSFLNNENDNKNNKKIVESNESEFLTFDSFFKN